MSWAPNAANGGFDAGFVELDDPWLGVLDEKETASRASLTCAESPLHSETSGTESGEPSFKQEPTNPPSRAASGSSQDKKSRRRAPGGDNAAACRRHRLRRKIEREELQKKIHTMVEERGIFMSRIADLQCEVEALRCAGLTTDTRLRMENELLRMQVLKMRASVTRLVQGVEQAETQASDEETLMLLRGCQDSSVAQILGIGYGCYDKSWHEGKRYYLFPNSPYSITFRYQLLPLGCDRASARRVALRFDMDARDSFVVLTAKEMFQVIWGSLSDPDFLDRVEHDIQRSTGKIRDITPKVSEPGIKLIAFDDEDEGSTDARLFSEARLTLEPCFDGPNPRYTEKVEAYVGCSITAPTNLVVEETNNDRSFLLGQIVRPQPDIRNGTLCTSIFSVPCDESIDRYLGEDGSLGPAIGERITAYAIHLESLGKEMMRKGLFPAIPPESAPRS